MVTKWTFHDPVNSETYTFEVNPKDGGLPALRKVLAFQSMAGSDGGLVTMETQPAPIVLNWTGTILSETEYNAFVFWFGKNHQVTLTDDFGQVNQVYLSSFTPTRKYVASYPWWHDYTVEAYVVALPALPSGGAGGGGGGGGGAVVGGGGGGGAIGGGGGGGGAVASAAPASLALPAISGVAQVGVVLSASTGSWANIPTSFAYQWAAGGVAISGATSASYTPVTGNVAATLTVAVTAVNAFGSTTATSAATAVVIAAGGGGSSGSWWVPTPLSTFQWQLSSPPSTAEIAATPAQIWDVDAQEATNASVAELHAAGAKVVAYIDVGGAEPGRPDYSQFPSNIKAANFLPGWTEYYVDVRALDVLRPIMTARIADAAAKGFDAVEPDVLDAYANPDVAGGTQPFPITAADEVAYITMIVGICHDYGMSCALKNDPDIASSLVGVCDFMINEQGVQYGEWNNPSPGLVDFTNAGKFVVDIEYSDQYSPAISVWGPALYAAGITPLRKHTSLDNFRQTYP